MVGKLVKKRADGTPVSALGEDTELDKEAFKEIIGKIDQGLRALPATAQVGCNSIVRSVFGGGNRLGAVVSIDYMLVSGGDGVMAWEHGIAMVIGDC